MMKKATRVLLLALMVFAVLCSRQVIACPHCNIHNYLAGSVQSSTNIFHGKVLREIDERTAEVEVLKVLRGQHKVDSKVKGEMYGSKQHVGKKFIFSDPTSMPPTFEVLPSDLEDEILFLIQDKPVVRNISEAIKCVQGVSVMTQGIGMEYLTNHYDEAIHPLIAELTTLEPQVFSTSQVFFGEHRLGMLVEALLSRQSDDAKAFVLACVGKLADQAQQKIDWASVPYNASSRGIFLTDILRHSQKHKGLAAELGSRLSSMLPELTGRTLADTIYALVVSGSDTPDGVQKTLGAKGSVDMVALGLYFAGNYESRWWQHDQAYDFWDRGMSLAKQRELKDAIVKAIADSERLWKRKTKNANQAPEDTARKLADPQR